MKSSKISCQDILYINTYPNEISFEYILQDILLGILGYPENHYISNISYKDILHVILWWNPKGYLVRISHISIHILMRYPVNISCRISCWESWDILKITIYPDEISFLAHQQTQNKCPISANSSAPCTTLLEGPAVQVWACPDAPDRCYGRGETGPNTDSSKIEYPRNSLFSPDKWAPAPPGDR